jgi:hypothetical protein
MIACKFSEHHIAHMQLFYPPGECHSQGEARGKGGSKAGAFCESCCVSSPQKGHEPMNSMDGCHGPNNLVFQPEHVGVPLTPPLLRDWGQTFDHPEAEEAG